MVERDDRRAQGGERGRSAIRLKFWGTRGSIPCSGASYLRYGGNTSCVEVWCGDHLIVLDGGSGIRDLGAALGEPPGPFDVFLTHCHFDHVCGLPFFAPFHDPAVRLRLWTGHLGGGLTSERMLNAFMTPPFFPVTPGIFKAQIDYRDFRTGDTLEPADDITVSTVRLHHPQGATGYCIAHRGAKICYFTDTEAGPGGLDPRLVEAASGADILIVDAMFTDRELSACAGWGHASWRQAVALAEAAGAGTLVLFHHHPMHDDAFMDTIAEEAQAARPGTIVARERMTLEA